MNEVKEKLIPYKLPTIANKSGRLLGEEQELQQLKEVIESETLACIYDTKVRQFKQTYLETVVLPWNEGMYSECFRFNC